MTQETSTILKLLFLTIILFAAKTSQAQWQPDTRLTNDPASSFMSGNSSRCISSSGDFAHVIWFDNRDGNSEIYYKRSTNGGKNWGTDTRLTYNSAASLFPSSSASGLVVYIVWEEYRHGNAEVYYKRSTDAGVSWGADIRLTNNWAHSYSPCMSVSGSNVNVVWFDERDGNREIYYKRSTDGGTNWGADIRLTYNNYISNIPVVSSSGLEVHVVWQDNRDGNEEIYTKHSTDGGLTFCPDTRLTNNWAKSLSPQISMYGLVVHITWFDERDGNQEIYYKHSTDGGTTWCPDTRLTYNSYTSKNPSITASGPAVHIFWQDNRDGNYEIYYKRSTDEGNIWGTDTRITNNYATSIFPFVSESGPVLNIIWEEYRDGNPEVYYKRDSTGNPQSINIDISVIVEGFYNAYEHLNIKDTERAYLRSAKSPYLIVDSAKSIIDSLTFKGSFYFNNAPEGSYYIILKHRNSIETWSRSGGESLTKGPSSSYNFTSAVTQAFGNNMKQVDASPVRFAVFSGDVNQDGFVDATDLALIDNDVSYYVYGFVPTDLNGDRSVDASDAAIADNNVSKFISVITP